MEIVATVLPLLLLAGAILTVVWAVRQQRHFRQNPDARPHGRRLLIRAAPFIVLSLALSVGCAAGRTRSGCTGNNRGPGTWLGSVETVGSTGLEHTPSGRRHRALHDHRI